MSYINVEQALPRELVAQIQKYVDGAYIYIPKLESNRKAWGETTSTKKDMAIRNYAIYEKYMDGCKIRKLAEEFFLSEKSIQRIVLNERRKKELAS